MADKLGRLLRHPMLAVATLGVIAVSPTELSAQARLDRATATFAGITYVVQPGDMLRVRIWGWPDVSSVIEGSFPVEASGIVYLPVIGALNVAGKTAEQVQEEFRTRFAQEQRNPVVTVRPLFAVSVMGEVGLPGVIDVAPGYTVFDAISITGGFTTSANRRAVMVVRKGGTKVITGSSSTEAAAAMAQTPLESGDRVVVERSRTSTFSALNVVLQSAWYVAALAVLIAK